MSIVASGDPGAPRAVPAPGRRSLSLRAKAMGGVACFALYLLAAGVVVSWQRDRLTPIVEDLEEIHQVESTLARVNTFAAQAVLRINESYLAAEPALVADAAELDIDSIRAGLGALERWYPRSESMIATLGESLALARAVPTRSRILELRAAMHSLVADLEALARGLRTRRDALWGDYRRLNDAVTLTATGLVLFGLAAFGGMVVVFFSRLSWDIRSLAARAVDVVSGYRGAPLPAVRGDEVGALMDAVNRMQLVLREREQQLEVTRQQRFHQEKMVAIGSLAAAVAHEINNPIAAIEGVAETIHTVRREGRCAMGAECLPELILEHTRRIVGITRQLSEMSSPRSNEAEWIDLNALVRRTCAFIGFDPRFRTVRMDLVLDPAVPAAWAVGDHVTQTLMNLLINAADALLEVEGRARAIEVRTEEAGNFVRLRLRDNGPGMPPEVLSRAFDEAFTTKAAGSGIGLFMCKTLVERDHGRIALESDPGSGTTATVLLPREAPG